MRLFIAFSLPAEIISELTRVVRPLSEKIDGIKWVSSTNLHLTIRFLGECQPKIVDQITPVLSEIASHHSSYAVALNPLLGAFPSLQNSRAIWAGIDGDMTVILNLIAAVETSVRSLGFEPESKKWSPHITLGRVREGVRIDSRLITQIRLAPQPFELDQLVLFQSQLTPAGPRYSAIASWRLGAERFA